MCGCTLQLSCASLNVETSFCFVYIVSKRLIFLSVVANTKYIVMSAT